MGCRIRRRHVARLTIDAMHMAAKLLARLRRRTGDRIRQYILRSKKGGAQ